MGKDTIKIALADAQYLVRAGFRHLFSKNLRTEVIGEAVDMEELRELVGAESPKVIVIDYQNCPPFTLDNIAELRQAHPEIEVMIVTDDQNKSHIRQALGMGVNCILTKHCSEAEIVSGTLSVAKGEKFFCHKVLEIILEKEEATDDCAPSNLSPREIEIVGMIATGLSTKDIAEKLFLSTHTLYTHRKNIMKKLQINSVSEMILFAMNTGIVRRPL